MTDCVVKVINRTKSLQDALQIVYDNKANNNKHDDIRKKSKLKSAVNRSINPRDVRQEEDMNLQMKEMYD